MDELIAKIKNFDCKDYRVATTYLLRWLAKAAEEEQTLSPIVLETALQSAINCVEVLNEWRK
ncbi:hypothetical protein [Caldibacillus debilis]|uniref:Uncharacterized protein n=1 Tax=Caldibacillus debilis TaxID=301148 RepID=A0A150L6Z1_9BACI|nr:hypothetical protein [Caldibacillus debilis]KYD08035.1 hypothetical protein B4135_4192 [Caldibacillus debilis]